MTKKTYAVPYPRRRLARGLARGLGRLLMPLAFRLEINGWENFPPAGPLVVVGNHVAVVEAALMVVYTPWPLEMVGSVDIPHEVFIRPIIGLYGFIPVKRGHVERTAMVNTLNVLKQGGIVGLFPEGGIWEQGAKRPQSGITWLSYHAGAPVLPMAFGGTLGSLEGALRLKRPRLTINVGTPIPAATRPPGMPVKRFFQEYANRVMGAVNDLLPPEERADQVEVVDERFELQITVRDPDGREVDSPPELRIDHPAALTKFLHRPAILKIFRVNLKLPTEPLEQLDRQPDVGTIIAAIQHVLHYMEDENPYFLAYRFGPKEAEAMLTGLHELLALARWADGRGLSLAIKPIRRYYSTSRGREVEQVKQGAFEQWM